MAIRPHHINALGPALSPLQPTSLLRCVGRPVAKRETVDTVATLRQEAQAAIAKFEDLMRSKPKEQPLQFNERDLRQLPLVTRAMEKGAQDACDDYGGSLDECLRSMLDKRLVSLKQFILTLTGRNERISKIEPELVALCADLKGLLESLRRFSPSSPLLDQELESVRSAYPVSREVLQELNKELARGQSLLVIANEVYPALLSRCSEAGEVSFLDQHGKRLLGLFQEVTEESEPWPEGGIWWPEGFDPVKDIWDSLSVREQALAEGLSIQARQDVASKAIDFYKYELEWQRAEDLAEWYSERAEHVG